MKELLPYIFIEKNIDGHALLTIEDYELFDFIEDYLIEKCDISYEYINRSNKNGREAITMTFPVTIEIESLEKSLLRITAEEIETIYMLSKGSNKS